ncbi:hypothetical protein D9M71_674620 [compost metagenome]
MLTWPLPSNSSLRPSRLSCCRLSRLMSRPITPTILPSCLSGKATLVISGVRSPTLSKYGSTTQASPVSSGQVSQRL